MSGNLQKVPSFPEPKNETLRTIYSRRSVRDFLPVEIPDEVIRELTRAGSYAKISSNGVLWSS